MPINSKVKRLYDALKADGGDVGTPEEFNSWFFKPGKEGYKNRKSVYDTFKADGADVGKNYEEFGKWLGLHAVYPTVNKYHQQMLNSVDPNKSRASELTHRAVGQAKRGMNNVRKPVRGAVVNKQGKKVSEFDITPAKTVEDLDREYAQETTKNWENELHDQMADADKDAAKISDMFKSFIGSMDEVGSVWGNMTRGGGIAGTPHSVTTNNGLMKNTEARQLLIAGDYNRKRRELLQLEQDSRNGAFFDNHSFFRGMYDAAKDTGFLTGGAFNLISGFTMLKTKQDLDNGVHTKAGDMLMQQAVKNSNAQSHYGDNKGWMYTGGVITTNMAPFIVQIASAGFSKGLSTSIGKVVQGAASKVALGTMKKAAGFASADLAKNIGKVTGLTTKAFGKAIQYGIVGAAQANTVGLGNVANDVINRYTGQVYQDEQGNYKFGTFDSDGKLVHEGGEDFLTAFVKGDAAQTIEFATELAGGGIDAVGTALKNFVTKGGKKIINKYNMENVSKVIDFLLNNKVSKNVRYLKAGADRTLGKVEVNSIVGESLEEELGIIANTVFTGDNKISDLWDEKQQSQIWGGMLLSIGLMKGAVAPFHAYNAKQYYSYKHKLNKADVNLSQLLGKEKWEELRNQIDATTNEDMPEMVNKINRDVALGKNRQPVREYIQNLLIMRGFDIGNMLAAKKAVEDKGEGVSVKNMEKNQAYQQGRDAYGYDTHEIQLDQEDKQKSLAQLIGISEQQLASMSDEELESFSGRDDNIDRAIYDYQLSSARYEGVVDNARDQIDLEVQRAAQAVDMYTDKSRNTIRNATIKASGGLEDYGVYVINGNIATHEDGSIDISNSDDMILYYDPTTNTVEHADAMMFAELGSEENADEVRSQAMADAKEKAIKETTGIIDGVVEVGTQFKTIDADGTEHTYEVLADNGDGTAMITIDGNIPTELVKGENVNIPVSFEELQKMKDEADQQRLQAAKAQREQMEKERAEQQMQSQTTQAENPAHEDNIQSAPIEDNIDYSDIIREDGKVQMVDVSDKYGNNLFPDAKDVFYIQGNKMRTKFAYIDANGELKTQSFPTGLVKIKTRGEVSVDDYKKYRNTILAAESSFIPESSKIEDNSGEIEGDRGGREVNDELPPVPDNVTINGDGTYSVDGAVQGGENTTAPSEQTEQTPAITLEDGTIVPMLEDGNPDLSKLSAAQTAELYDTQFDEDAGGIVSGYVSDAKKALDKANNMTVKGKTFVEQKAAKVAKEKAIADAQAAYDSAIAIRDAYNERQLAKEENTPEGRKSLIEKAKRKFARLKNSEEWSERPGDLWNETVGKLLHRLYDVTGIDVFNDTPNTVYEYVAANVGPYSLNYEGNDNSKGVQQETGLSRSDFAKLGWLAAEGKGMTIDAKVHRLWENRPSNLESADTQEIRNALISLITSGQTAFQARDYILNQRIELAESALEEQLRQEEDAAEARRAKEEEEKKKSELEKKKAEEEKTNENRNAPELSHEQQKAKEEGEKLGFPAVDKEGEPINQNVIELANWAKEQGLEIDPTSKSNSYADLYVMCKEGFGVSTLVPDVGENINQVFYFPENVQGEQLLKLQEEFNVGRDLKHAADMNSELTEGAMFYDVDTAREFRDFVNEKVKEESKTIEVPEDATDEKPLGEQLSEDKVPFKIEGEKSGVTYDINDKEDRKRLVAENSVDDKDILDIDMPKHVHKAIKELCKKMGLKVQFLYMGARLNGWIENGTMYLALDANKATQFVFGHEMTHAIKQKNPEAYKELVKVAMAVTTKKKFEEDLAKVYRIYHNASGYNNIDDFVEEVIADNIGKFINDYDLAQRFVLRLNHPVLATILHAIQKIKSLLYGDFYKSVDALERIVEKAYVKTAKGEVTNSETGEDVSFSLRQKPEPKKKVLADNWRRFYNRAVHNELNDVRKKAWGNYKLFDLDRPFADQVNEVKGNVPDEFDAPDAATNKDNIKGLDRQVSSAAEPHYSLKDEKTLAGVHNITEEKLRKAIKQGGLANPSVAVIDSSKQNHEGYGDISLILSSDKVAKRTGKNAGTWQGDAWTPTYPQVERQMSNKGAGKASKDVSSVPGDMYREVRRGLDRWLDGGEANSAMAYMFLHEKGVAPEPKKIQRKFSDDVYNELKSITAGDFNIYGIGKADAQKVLGMYIDAKFDGDKDLYEEKTKAWLERNKSIVDAGNKGGMRYTIAKENVELYDEYGFNFKGVQTFVRDVEYDHRKTGVDMNATLNEVEDYIKTNNLTDEFNTWLEGKEKEYGIKEVIFDGFTPSGNRRYVPNTLENVSKIMKKQGRNGATGISVSFQNFAASLMPSYGTLKDIRSKKGLLTSDHEDLDKFNEKWSKVFFELGMKCQPDATGTFDDYGLARLSEAAKTSDPQAYLKKEYNVDFSDEDTKRLKEMVKAIKEESPAMYFETKFERPVGFNEFSSAVVPTTASDEVKQALQNAGVQIYEYDKEKEGDRSRAFNEAINSSDNIRFSLKQTNDKFNSDLKSYVENGVLPENSRFELGFPSDILLSAGFPKLPISMRVSLLNKKAGMERHPFSPTDLYNLADAIQKPLAIFEYTKPNMRNLIVGLTKGEKHFLIGVTLDYRKGDLAVNSISGLFPKENHEWIKWIQDGKAIRIDKKDKVLSLINSLRTNPEEAERIGLNLDSAAKIIKDFENPSVSSENSSSDTKFSLRGSTFYEKQMEEWKEKNHLEKGAVPMEKPTMKEGENIFDYANRMVEWTRNQNLWKTAPKQTGFQDALAKWKADNGLSPDAYPPVRPHREYYSSEIGYTEDLEEYNKKKELWKSAPKPKDFDLSVDLEDMNKQLRNIRRAVLNQKNYDQRTVKAVSDLVKKMLNIGWGDGLSRGKVGNLLSAAKNATGANDVKKYLDKVMGILAENYLNRLSTAYDNLINTKGARADQSGVIKMGSLDAKGQAFMSEYKKAINMDDSSLNTYIANIEEDSAKNEDNVEMNDYRLAGIQAAIMYKQQIGGNDADISELQRQIGELKNKKDATKEDKDLLKSLEKKLFENKFDRITMYENLLNNIQRMVKESKGRAKEFREEITEHKNEILHRANLDLEGVDSTYYDTTTAKKKFVNNDLQRAVFSSTYTFEQFLKFFGKHSANGEGRLYNYFHKLNQDALDEEQLYNEMNRNALDEKTKELFGKEKFMKLVGIDSKGMKEMDIEVTDYSNKKTGKRTIHLKQGQMLYIYLVNKETDGEMKLRAMGITEEDVAAIEENLDPRVKAMGVWLQDEYLPECQRRYQATHTKYFGAPMKEVENYFPLAINNRARNVKEDVNQDSDAMSQLAGTSTGAIVTRRVNVIPLDIENADAFEVAFNHLQEMEEWSAMLPFRQDINTLLSYTHFRNQVQNMSSVAYGSGKTLWDEFKQTAQIAAGTYKPKVNAGMMDSRIAAAMGGIAVAKISGRLWTAIKQSQSATVFLPECDFTRFVKNGVNPYGSWKWAMETIPDFRKRVENMTYGDVKLRQYLDELEKWHDWTKTISKIGMAPNILVDGITCAVGARSVYETEVNRLTKLGYPKDKADEKAYYKAVAAYNKTQQSSGGMYLSPMQVDRTYVSAALSLFKNANYAYGRMQIEACRGLARTYDFWGGKHKTTLIESMTRQIMGEDGLNENTARTIAKATYNRTFRQSIGRLINFATLIPVTWALYKVLPYLLTGDDDDKKKDMIEEAVLKGFVTSLSDNYVIPFVSNILNAGLKVEDGKPTFDPEVFRYQNLYINPATSDLANIYSMVGNQKWYSVVNKLGMLGVQSLIGFNPETVGALYQAFAEADYDNGNTAKEWQIGILKAISAPEESIRELYMDELGLKSGDIKKIPLAELEKRYAERQINRDNLLSQIGMDSETFNGYVDKYQKSFEKKIKDKMDKWDEYDKKKADEFFDTTSDPKLKDMIEKKRAKDANAAADEQIAKEGLSQEKKGKELNEEAYDAVKMSIDVAEDNAISTYNKVLDKRYAALNDEYNEQTDTMKYIFMSKHPNFKAYKDLKSEYTTYGKKIKKLKEKLVSADGYDAKQTILKQIRTEREKFSKLQSKVR